MRQHRATLILDIHELLLLMRQYLAPFLAPYIYGGLDEEALLKWIIEEEIETAHCLFVPNHIHNHYPYQVLHAQLNQALPWPLHQYVSHYIKAPQLYGDNNEINITIKYDRDLYIEYLTDLYMSPYQPYC